MLMLSENAILDAL